jgi:phage head maturation protease
MQSDITLSHQGTAIKATGDGKVGGYLVVFGDAKTKDLQGEYFTAKTDFAMDWFQLRPALYHHGLDGVLKTVPIGTITSLKVDEIGIWAEAQLDMHKRYVEAVAKLVKEGALHWSSGSLAHLVEVAEDGEIKRWPLVEGSMTPTPAEPRNTDIKAIKSAYEELGLDTTKLRLSAADNTHMPKEVITPKEAQSGLKADGLEIEIELEDPLEENEMAELTDEMKSAIREYMDEVKAEMKAEDNPLTDEEVTKAEEEVTEESEKMV